MRKNSVKNNRINGEVQRELSRIISREIKDPRISPMTSVVDVVVTPDLKFCKAYISVLGDQDAVDSTFAGLTPEITFIMDQSIEYGVSMSHKIDEALGKHGDADESTDENSESEDEFEE